MIGKRSRNNFGGNWGYSLGGSRVNGNLFLVGKGSKEEIHCPLDTSQPLKKKKKSSIGGAEAPLYAFFTGDFSGKNENRRSGGRGMTNST